MAKPEAQPQQGDNAKREQNDFRDLLAATGPNHQQEAQAPKGEESEPRKMLRALEGNSIAKTPDDEPPPHTEESER